MLLTWMQHKKKLEKNYWKSFLFFCSSCSAFKRRHWCNEVEKKKKKTFSCHKIDLKRLPLNVIDHVQQFFRYSLLSFFLTVQLCQKIGDVRNKFYFCKLWDFFSSAVPILECVGWEIFVDCLKVYMTVELTKLWSSAYPKGYSDQIACYV